MKSKSLDQAVDEVFLGSKGMGVRCCVRQEL